MMGDAKRWFFLCGFAALTVCPNTYATLGEAANSVQSDAAALRSAALPRAVSSPAYTVQRINLPTGIVVDQYVSAAGVVFAINWRGVRPPDLAQLFGRYFDEYQAAATIPHERRPQLRIDTGRLIYQTGGHMRDLWGSAVLPALLPAGFSASDLR